jgi:hypothetical protein
VVRRLALPTSLVMLTLLFAASDGWTDAGGSTADGAVQPQTMIRVRDSSVIYVVDTTKCDHAPCVELQRTDNDGTTFTKLSLPPISKYQNNPTGTLDDLLVFANDEVGFALEGRVWRTRLYATYDGGHSWRRVSLPRGVDIMSVAATSTRLYVVTMDCTKEANGNWGCRNYNLIRTSLRPHGWSSTPIPVGRHPQDATVGPVSAFANRLWMTRMAFPKSTREAAETLLLSSDGGRVLNTSPETALGYVNGCGLTAMSEVDLWAECPTGMQVSFWFSGDAGTTWNSVPANQFMGTGGGNFAPVSAAMAYLDYGPFGIRPDFFRVSNDGRTLTAVGELRCTNVRSLAFINREDGLALCDNYVTSTLERTANAGRSWRQLAVG